MTDEPAAERQLVLSMLPAGRGERRFAVAIVALSFAILFAAAPFADVPLAKLPAFIPCYESALILNDLLTAALLFGQFTITRTPALLVLASGYLFTMAMTVAHALTFPGLFSDGGLLGAGPQSTAWLYMFWHGGFPVAVAGYAVIESRGPDRIRVPVSTAILLGIAAVLALTAAFTALATAGTTSLPEIMQDNHYTPAMIFVVAGVWSLSLLALLVLFVRRSHSVLDLWLMVVLCAWLCDVALSAVLNAGRYDLGFYAGRIYGLSAASFILVVLLLETGALYARLARSLEAERQERERRLRDMRSELIHLSRLSELGQMVSALAHEVNQPLTAIGNYIRASQRLIESADLARTQSALEKAAKEASRAGDIVKHLRDFIRKSDSDKRMEDLATTIEETMVLALVGAERSDVSLEVQLDPEASTAFIDKVQIQQVLLNLIRNAIEAMSGGPRRFLAVAARPSANEMVEVSVADSGPGLATEVREKLFQPFVTTKENGMGVGLSICRSIVEGHGGRIWAENNPGGGTVFRLTLPRTRMASMPAA